MTVAAGQINRCQRGGHGAGGGEQLAPSVIGVAYHLRAGSVYKAGNIPLRVAEVVIRCAMFISHMGF